MKLNVTCITESSPELCRQINRLLQDLTARPRTLDHDTLTALLACPDTHLFTACTPDGTAPVAMFTLAVTRLPTGDNIWLEDLVVDRQHQRQGYGRELVLHAIEQARHICPGGRLMLTSRPARLAANHIYSGLFGRKETNVYCLQL